MTLTPCGNSSQHDALHGIFWRFLKKTLIGRVRVICLSAVGPDPTSASPSKKSAAVSVIAQAMAISLEDVRSLAGSE